MSLKITDNKSPSSEEALIASAKSGDDHAFATLANSYKRVLELQIKLCNPPVFMKEDLFQDGLIGLFKAVKTYDGKTSAFSTYASTCVRNSILSGIRKYSNQTAKTVVLNEEYSEETVPSAEDVLLDSVRARVLYEKVCDVLSPYERTVFDMYLSDLPYDDIAFVTGKTVKSTSNAIYRIRTKLKSIITKSDDIPQQNKKPE